MRECDTHVWPCRTCTVNKGLLARSKITANVVDVAALAPMHKASTSAPRHSSSHRHTGPVRANAIQTQKDPNEIKLYCLQTTAALIQRPLICDSVTAHTMAVSAKASTFAVGTPVRQHTVLRTQARRPSRFKTALVLLAHFKAISTYNGDQSVRVNVQDICPSPRKVRR